MELDLNELNSFGKNILFTGANSGIGFYSLINLLKKENYLFIPIRSESRKKILLEKLKSNFKNEFLSKYLNIIDNVDFSNLKNINKVREYFLKEEKLLDIVILNAGMQYTGALYPKVSKQGIELTFAVNHLAHFYLINNLFPLINNSLESRIIITSSDVHNPKSSGGNVGEKAGLNNLENFRDIISGRFINFSADKAYKNSKLCNILFAKHLSKKISHKKSKISVLTWAPGLVIPEDDLGFFRYSSKFNKFGYLIFSIIAKNILGITASPEDTGNILCEIAMAKSFNNIEYLHLSNQLIAYKKHKLKKVNVSEEANNSELAEKLWTFSSELCRSFSFDAFYL
tara:strand:- start:19754 stop:20779 length:1026 start_codon:yes stop_codon:yes gene_type:complete